MNNIPDILEKIIEYKSGEVKAAKQTHSQSEIEKLALAASPVRGFENAIKNKIQTGYALIAEVKKASPSKGLIREDFEPSILAKSYENGGATCLSILTDGPSFMGADEYLITARNSTNLPALRKDFMIDPYQIAQSRALGADAILIIMACLSDEQAQELFEEATKFGMDALIETHDEYELERALKLGGNLIGVNNRNLRTFETKLETTEALAKLLPKDKILVCESGLFTNADLQRMEKSGAKTFLIGESLMRQENVTKATKELLGI